METKYIVGNKRIEIFSDENSLNPFKEWDCEPDIRINYGRRSNFIEHGVTEISYTVRGILSSMPNIVIRNQKEIADLLDIDFEYLIENNETKEDKVYHLCNEIDNSLSNEVLYKLCLIAKIPCKLHESKGYSQGDYASVLIIITSEYLERIGGDRRKNKSYLESTAKLFDNWAWGNVYGFKLFERKDYVKIPRSDFDNLITDNIEELIEWKQIDSCGGFYGDNFDTNGMLDHVGNEFEEILKNYDYKDIK
jgi:hypothetical protein